MSVPAASKAHRILRKLRNYHSLDTVNDLHDCVKEIPFAADEALIGIYENQPGECTDIVVVTELGLHIFHSGRWEFLAYSEIAELSAGQIFEEEDNTKSIITKHTIEGLYAHAKSGQVVWIPVRGGHGRFRDAWEFLRFLRDVARPSISPNSTGRN